jgi:hypothetical protein
MSEGYPMVDGVTDEQIGEVRGMAWTGIVLSALLFVASIAWAPGWIPWTGGLSVFATAMGVRALRNPVLLVRTDPDKLASRIRRDGLPEPERAEDAFEARIRVGEMLDVLRPRAVPRFWTRTTIGYVALGAGLLAAGQLVPGLQAWAAPGFGLAAGMFALEALFEWPKRRDAARAVQVLEGHLAGLVERRKAD